MSKGVIIIVCEKYYVNVACQLHNRAKRNDNLKAVSFFSFKTIQIYIFMRTARFHFNYYKDKTWMNMKIIYLLYNMLNSLCEGLYKH